ncbi:MAG: beta-lactamase family protein [Acidimicrobiia bacterium]|nr:beta-lactamase family protein [Acidimicrobiia bacterium]
MPADLESVMARGSEEPATVDVEPVWNRAVGVYRSGVHPAIQLCVVHQGRIVLDRSIGHARGVAPGGSLDAPGVVPLTPETPMNLFSAAKALTAMVMHLLEERGAIELDAPVSRYVPGFERHGKGAITLRHVLTHRAGIPSLPAEVFALDLLSDPERVEAVLCDLHPRTGPTRAPAYHALSGGFVMDAVARRATGRGVREILTTEVKEPLGLRWFDFGLTGSEAERVVSNVCTGVPLVPPLSLIMRRLIGIGWDDAVRLTNDPRYVSGVVPSGNGLVTARDVATFYQCLLAGGTAQGVRVFEPETIRRAVRADQPRASIDRMIGIPMRYGTGFMLGTRTLSLFGWNHPQAFGHVGLANSFTWADPERDLAVALITNGKAVIGTHLPALVQLIAEIHRTFPVVAAG